MKSEALKHLLQSLGLAPSHFDLTGSLKEELKLKLSGHDEMKEDVEDGLRFKQTFLL